MVREQVRDELRTGSNATDFFVFLNCGVRGPYLAARPGCVSWGGGHPRRDGTLRAVLRRLGGGGAAAGPW